MTGRRLARPQLGGDRLPLLDEGEAGLVQRGAGGVDPAASCSDLAAALVEQAESVGLPLAHALGREPQRRHHDVAAAT